MKYPLLIITIFLGAGLSAVVHAQDNTQENRISTRVDTTQSGGLTMVQEFTVNVPVSAVWDAYTTEEGWEGWAVPMAELDFRINGTIKTNYNPEGTIGDSTTIVTHIINYVPGHLLTLQSEITENFPGFMKEDEQNFYNIIEMEPAGESATRVVSYGIGYRNTEQYLGLMEYFIKANEQTLGNLIRYLEDSTATNR